MRAKYEYKGRYSTPSFSRQINHEIKTALEDFRSRVCEWVLSNVESGDVQEILLDGLYVNASYSKGTPIGVPSRVSYKGPLVLIEVSLSVFSVNSISISRRYLATIQFDGKASGVEDYYLRSLDKFDAPNSSLYQYMSREANELFDYVSDLSLNSFMNVLDPYIKEFSKENVKGWDMKRYVKSSIQVPSEDQLTLKLTQMTINQMDSDYSVSKEEAIRETLEYCKYLIEGNMAGFPDHLYDDWTLDDENWWIYNGE